MSVAQWLFIIAALVAALACWMIALEDYEGSICTCRLHSDADCLPDGLCCPLEHGHCACGDAP